MEKGPGPQKTAALEQRMKELGIRREDIREKFIKAGGRGGQKVNKSNSAVFVHHTKTDLSVKCQDSRSQHLNRFLALRRLVDKIEAQLTGKTSGRLSKQESKIEKIKKQKLRRKRKNKKKQENKIKSGD